MSAPRILVLGGKAGIVRKAAALGFEITHVQKPSAFDPAVVDHCAQLLLVDYQDVPTVTALVRALHEQRPFARVFTQTEAAQVVATTSPTSSGCPATAPGPPASCTTSPPCADSSTTRASAPSPRSAPPAARSCAPSPPATAPR
ncbi:hypothetical protein ACFQVA_41585 [Actinomadura keratinilytica]